MITIDTPVSVLKLSSRAHNILRNAEIVTVGDLERLGRRYLLGCPNCGDKTVDEIVAEVDASGFKLWASTAWVRSELLEAITRTKAVLGRAMAQLERQQNRLEDEK